jgi:hypothetical protein
MDRAYSALSIKAIEDRGEFVFIKGIASTPTLDRQGDIVVPQGARFALPLPLLWQHKHDKPVGHVTDAKATSGNIQFDARIPVVREPGALKDRIDEAIQSLRLKLVAFTSIGFTPVAEAIKRIASGYQYDLWNWHELSLVTIPAQPEAVISSVKALAESDSPHLLTPELLSAIKSADQAARRAASGANGARSVVRLDLPAAAGATTPGVSGTPSPRRKGVVYLN